MDSFSHLNRDEYFYLPGKVLHIDADKEYLDRCMKFYKNMNVLCWNCYEEKDVSSNIEKYLNEIKPDILVITGHDAYNSKDYDDYKDNNNYKNSMNFISAVRNAKEICQKDQEKLIIIAGACQSNYEELIKAGSNFASSPKRVRSITLSILLL